jgi:TPP-dependent indolepyruvate ferredoxin oxidoreductase alpha subunit
MQRWRDEARRFVSGYRGSPLGMVDQQISGRRAGGGRKRA